ncbi:hypothetical protein G4228_007566 [Cervus hanglu yarkandensis]|nr:hypothetical protein G4228_007566 [Cervus hanglu yarkandensis]
MWTPPARPARRSLAPPPPPPPLVPHGPDGSAPPSLAPPPRHTRPGWPRPRAPPRPLTAPPRPSFVAPRPLTCRARPDGPSPSLAPPPHWPLPAPHLSRTAWMASAALS